MAMGPREGRVLHAMSIDDAYEVQRVLSSGSGGRTEVVTIDGFGPYLRKKIPSPLVDRRVWAALSECVGLRLPHVVATYETPDEFVVVCDFVPGDTLYEVVSAQGRLPVSEAVRIALEVCEAVEELHRRGIAHCDISPRNVLLAADGAHLIDLGIARPLSRALRRLRTLEPTGLRRPSSMGSRRSMSARTFMLQRGCWDSCLRGLSRGMPIGWHSWMNLLCLPRCAP